MGRIMKVLRILFCSLFFIILSVPLITFNTEEDAVSEIDNKMLAKNPLKDGLTKDTLQDDLEVYISERIGWETFLKQDIQYLKNNLKELHLRRT